MEESNNKNTISNSNITVGGNFHLGDIINVDPAAHEQRGRPKAFDQNKAEEIKALIAKSKVKEVIDQLLRFSKSLDEDLYKQCIHQAERWNRLQEQQRLDQISEQDADVLKNRIAHNLLSIVDDLLAMGK